MANGSLALYYTKWVRRTEMILKHKGNVKSLVNLFILELHDKQKSQIFFRQSRELLGVLADGAVEERLFLFLQLDDTRFDRVFDNETGNCNRPALTKTMNAIHGLFLYSGIPPRVAKENVTGLCQV